MTIIRSIVLVAVVLTACDHKRDRLEHHRLGCLDYAEFILERCQGECGFVYQDAFEACKETIARGEEVCVPGYDCSVMRIEPRTTSLPESVSP